MKLILTTAVSALMLSAPAFAETAPPAPPSTPKDAKTDFTKPFIYDGLKQQVPPQPQPPAPYIELKAGPESK